MGTDLDAALRPVVELMNAARRVVVLTGAGMSAESGLPTFRDKMTGLWSRFDPMTLATPMAFLEDALLVWAWYMRRLLMIRETTPNAGHRALAELERRSTGRDQHVTVVTQNVDDLHERAGSSRVLHLHGRLDALHCFDCGAPYLSPVDPPREEVERVEPPKCPQCRGKIRPGVVWFGENLPHDVLAESVEAVGASDIVLVVGTSGIVYPAAGLPSAARAAGASVIEINPDETEATHMCDHVIRSTAAVALPALIDAALTSAA